MTKKRKSIRRRRNMIDPSVAWDKLSSFHTADEIRDYFVNEGVLGFQGRPMSCPIAVWMSDQTGLLTTVASQVRVSKSEADFWDPQMGIVFEHSPATWNFMENFDNAAYPELDLLHPEPDCG